MRLAAHADRGGDGARFSAKAPKGASSSVSTPLMVMSLLTGMS